MKIKIIIIGACLLVVVGFISYFLYTGAGKKAAEKIGGTGPAKTGETAPAGHQHGGGVPPPQQSADSSGKAAEEAPTVEIPQDKQQMIGLKTAKAAVMPLEKVIRTVGRIEYDEKRLATVNTKFEGWIEKLYVDYTGRMVKKGEPLAEIYSPELLATQHEYLNTLRWARQRGEIKGETASLLAKDAQVILDAARDRLRFFDISDDQIREIEKAGQPIRTRTVFSPVTGVVLQKTALQGMRVMPGEKLFDVADLSSLWIVSDIYEYELPLIKVGQRARISLSYFPGREFSSSVDYVYPSLSGETRTAKARFTIPNPEGVLKPQMFTNVEIRIGMGSKLAVPADAVINTGVRQIVYVDRGDGNFEPREVMTGVKTEDKVEIVMGLKAGEKVAASANFLIDSEAQLKGVTALPGGHNHK